MPVAPLMGMALSRQSLKPFHSPGLCEAVITIPAVQPCRRTAKLNSGVGLNVSNK
jgi:hypothetical protein